MIEFARRLLLVTIALLSVGALCTLSALAAEDAEDAEDAQNVVDPDLDPLSAEEDIEEITVTATKRAERIQSVPISITALSGQVFDDAGITRFSQLDHFVPNLQIAPATDTRSTAIRIRGIGSTGTNAGIDPSVGVFIDGVYQGRSGMSVGDLIDIERVEVLRGPQGTLYGKNTAAGAINIVTKRPNYEWDTFLEAVIGNYNMMEFRGSANLPIVTDRVALRVSGYKALRDGFDTNYYNGQEVNDNNKYGIRGQLVWDITDKVSVLLSGDFSEQNDKCCVADIITYDGYSGLGTAFRDIDSYRLRPTDPYIGLATFSGIPLPSDVDPFDRIVGANEQVKNVVNVAGAAVDVQWAPGEHLFRWLNAYRTYSSDSRFDGDFSIYDAVLAFADVKLHQFSSEPTWVSPSWTHFEAQAGLFFYYSTLHTVDRNGVQPTYVAANALLSLQAPPGGAIVNINDNTHDVLSVAGYGQGTWKIIEDTLSFTGGLRVTYEQKSRVLNSVSTLKFNAPPVGGPDIYLDQSRSVTNFQWRADIRYFPIYDVMIYASAANGFKSGGFNQQRTNDAPNEFDDEHAINVELGTKTSWFDNKLVANLTGYFTDYHDFQAQIFTGTAITVRNAGRLFSYGFESELVYRPIDDLQLGTAIGFNIAEYKDFVGAENTIVNQAIIVGDNLRHPEAPKLTGINCGLPQIDCTQDLSGEVLDNAPRWTISAFTGYERELPRFPALWFARADYSYTSEYYLAQDLDPYLLQPGYHLLNLRAGLRAEDDLWELTFWVDNVTNTSWLVAGFDVPVVGGFAGINAPPRTYGGTVRMRF